MLNQKQSKKKIIFIGHMKRLMYLMWSVVNTKQNVREHTSRKVCCAYALRPVHMIRLVPHNSFQIH